MVDEVVKERIESIARLAVAVIASICTILGWSFNAEIWANLLVSAFTLFWLVKKVWWKNQNCTEAAHKGQQVTNAIKDGEEVTVTIGENEVLG